MYRGFNISEISAETFSRLNFTDHSDIHDGLAKCGAGIGAKFKNDIEGAIGAFERNGKVRFSGNEIEGLCFPRLEFDVFISHSHNDERTAFELAGFLWYWCGVKAFVDSCAWNYRDEIIKRIVKLSAKDHDLTSDAYLDLYVSVASHVDCMLNKSLIGMIDECESLFFLNTPNSIASSKLGSVTYSPWIYAELEASRVVAKEKSKRRPHLIKESFAEDESPFVMSFDVSIDHLTPVTGSAIVSWGCDAFKRAAKGFDALDDIYVRYPLNGPT